MKELRAKIKEALMSVLPVTAMVYLLAATPLLDLSRTELATFTIGAVMLILGIGLFSMGADLAMTPMGTHVGSGLSKQKKLGLLLGVCFVLGVLITIAEPDLQVLAGQVRSVINGTVLTYAVGIGVGATLLSLILPLFRRYSDEVNQVRSKLESRQVTLDYCRTMMAGYRREQFYVICLTADGSIICNRKVTEGTLSAVTAYPRLVLEAALNSNAHSVVLCHNHPGGVALPSEDDICTTRYLQQLMEGVGIIVLDHVIVAGNQTYSMAQHGELLHPSEIMRAMVAAAEKPLRK